MDDLAIKELARKYRPIVYLHPQEAYMPIDFTRYINESRLKSSNGIFKPDEIFDSVKFGQWLYDYPEINSQDYTLYLPDGETSPCIAEYNPDLQTVPIYVNYRTVRDNLINGNHLYISYSFMYAYNGPEPVCCYNVGQHYADSEHVTAHIFVTGAGDVTFNQLYNSRHCGGVWIDGADLIWRNDRPLVFSSLNGHASYNNSGHYARYWGVAVDRCSYGPLWDTPILTFLPKSWAESEPTQRWTLFRGNLGDWHVDGFGAKRYMTQTDLAGEYGASLWPGNWKT